MSTTTAAITMMNETATAASISPTFISRKTLVDRTSVFIRVAPEKISSGPNSPSDLAQASVKAVRIPRSASGSNTQPKSACQQRVEELADLLGIEHLLDRKPQGLSGGERQRVALGRALSFQPRVLCLDEPLSALDDDTRVRMCELLSDVQKKTGTTTLHVTHNRDEAERLADYLFRIEDGQILQVRPEPQAAV